MHGGTEGGAYSAAWDAQGDFKGPIPDERS
jgi:hypothetical protein